MRDTAWFVKYPRRIDELKLLHDLAAESAFEIVGRVELDDMDYDNFITDLLADRAFLEPYALVCGMGDPLRCVLVSCPDRADGVLVVPERGCYVQYAALYRR